MKRLDIGLWYLNEMLKGGFKEGYNYEISGYPWDIVKDHIHYIIPNLAIQDRLTILYGQYFEGLNPYRIAKYCRIYGIEYSEIKDRVRLARGFKGEDYVDGVKRLERIDGILILVDPYLHAYMTGKKHLFGAIASQIYKLKRLGKTIILFNRLLANRKPLGGEFHRHIADYIVSMIYSDGYLHIELIKALDIPNKSMTIEYEPGYPPLKKKIQHTILEWIR